MSTSKTIQLDPAAVEAATTALENYFVDGPFRAGWEPEARAAITAYLAAIEPQVREALNRLIELHTASVADSDNPNLTSNGVAFVRSYFDFLRLLGMEVTAS